MSQRHGQRRHPQILAPAGPADGSTASANKRKGSPCQQDDDSFSKENGDGDSQSCETMICPVPDLPEVVNAPMLPTKFLCLKRLTICLSLGPFPWSFDYFSLVSFLDVSPSLENLSLDVTKEPMKQESIFRHSKHLRQMAEDQHCYLKNVTITGFSSTKSLVELVCYILKNAVSLECLTLDTLYVSSWRCSDQRSGCCYVGNDVRKVLKEARRALGAIRTYIEDKVPAGVKLTVLEPCSLCHKL